MTTNAKWLEKRYGACKRSHTAPFSTGRMLDGARWTRASSTAVFLASNPNVAYIRGIDLHVKIRFNHSSCRKEFVNVRKQECCMLCNPVEIGQGLLLSHVYNLEAC